jgi:hypothetical protein
MHSVASYSSYCKKMEVKVNVFYCFVVQWWCGATWSGVRLLILILTSCLIACMQQQQQLMVIRRRREAFYTAIPCYSSDPADKATSTHP